MDFKKWLTENKLKFDICLSQTACHKWTKYYYHGEKPYPCVCPRREGNCIFIETYYELQKVLKLSQQLIYYQNAIKQYTLIKDNSDAVLEWTKQHQQVGSKLFFKTEITILLNSDPIKKLKIQLIPDEFDAILQFQELFDASYYSETYPNKY